MTLNPFQLRSPFDPKNKSKEEAPEEFLFSEEERQELAQLASNLDDDELETFNNSMEQLIAAKRLQKKINQNPSFTELFQEGVQESTGNLILHNIQGFDKGLEAFGIEKFPTLKEQSLRGQRDLNFLDNLIKGSGTFFGDIPTMTVGSIAAGGMATPTGPVGMTLAAGAGGFALPTAIANSYREYQQFFEENPDADITFGEYLDAVGRVAKETGKSAVIGAATSVVRPLVAGLSKFPAFKNLLNTKIAKAGAEIVGETAVITGARAAIEGKIPSGEEFAQNLLLLGAYRISRAGATKFGDWAKTKGLTGKEAVEILDRLDKAEMEKMDKAQSIDDIQDIVKEKAQIEFKPEGEVETKPVEKPTEPTEKPTEKPKKFVDFPIEVKDVPKKKEVDKPKGKTPQKVKLIKPVSKHFPVNEVLVEEDGSILKDSKPVTIDVYRGTGGGGIVEFDIPLLGEATYYALTEKTAKDYGKNISKETITLNNPLVLNSSQDLRKELGLNYIPSGEDLRENYRDQLMKKYDGIIVHASRTNDNSLLDGKNIKGLNKLFLDSQVIVFPKTVTKAKEVFDKVEEPTIPKPKEPTPKEIDVDKQLEMVDAPLEEELPKGEDLALKKDPITGQSVAFLRSPKVEAEPIKGASAYEKLGNKFRKIKETWDRIWSVEQPFKNIGGNETGRQAKLYYTTVENSQTEAIDVIKKLKELGYNRKDRGALVLLSEAKELPQEFKEKYGKGYKVIRKYFDDSGKQLQEVNAIAELFPQSLINRIENDNAELEKTIARNKSAVDREREAISKKIFELSQEENKLKRKLFEIKKENNALASRITEAKNEVERLTKKVTRLKRTLNRLTRLKKKPPSTLKTITKLQNEIERLSKSHTLAKQKESMLLKKLLNSKKEQGEVSNSISKSKEEQKKLSSRKKRIPKPKNKELLSRISANKQAIEKLKNTAFVHIPYGLWFSNAYDRNPQKIVNTINSLTNKQRKSLTIADLLNTGRIKAEDLDIADIIGAYGYNKGKDLAIYKLMKSAEKEGLASRERKPGFTRIDKHFSNVAHQFYIHPVLFDFLLPIFRRRPNPFLNFMGIIKGYQFYNFLFLPGYDLYQNFMVGVFNKPHKLPQLFIKSYKDVMNRSKDWKEAMQYGLASSPFNITQKEYDALIERAKNGFPQELQKLLSPQIFNKMYEYSSTAAWWLDRYLRMVSYNKLRADGLSPLEAAQVAATFHGDYATVPLSTRRVLNGIFFTPSFKIAMGKLFKQMLKSSFKVAKDILKGEKLDPKDKAFAMGLINATIALGIISLIYKMLGFEEDIPGYRWTKRIEEGEHKDRELAIVQASPINMPIKYFSRLYEPLRDPAEINAYKKFARQMSWEIAPLWRILGNLVSNVDQAGRPIRDSIGDTVAKQTIDSVHFVMKQVLPWTAIAEIDEESEQSRKQVKKELGQIMELLIRPFSHHYIRDSFEEREAQKITRLIRNLQDRYRKGLTDPNVKPMTIEQVDRHIEAMRKVSKNLDDERRKREEEKMLKKSKTFRP